MKVIVTGAASGIGRAVATQLAAGGHQMLLVDREPKGLAETVALVGAGATALTADLALPGCGDTIAAAAKKVLGGVDWFVSNAGIFRVSPLATMSVEDFDAVIAINTRATWLIAKAIYPMLQASDHAAIAVTASVSGYHPSPPLGAYSLSKAALMMLVKQIANEWGPDGIRCNSVSPAATLTGMIPAAMTSPDQIKAREALSPLRKVNYPVDVADVILFLLSDAARNVTGVDIPVDSGTMLTLVSSAGVGPGKALASS
jgi:NAD(P)-dependent dehydrogenase (short-subunit alcohol dehydrogenase family)